MVRRALPVAIVLAFVLAASSVSTSPQAKAARISESVRTIPTYPFSEPNATPILAKDTRLYPYHSFEGYSHEAVPRQWKVVHDFPPYRNRSAMLEYDAPHVLQARDQFVVDSGRFQLRGRRPWLSRRDVRVAARHGVALLCVSAEAPGWGC